MRERISKLKNKLKNQKGFTLVELLATIVILGIIVAIAVPAVGSILDNAKTSAAEANVELVENAAEIAHIATNGDDSVTYTAVGLESEGFLKINPDEAAEFDAGYTLSRTGNSGAYTATKIE